MGSPLSRLKAVEAELDSIRNKLEEDDACFEDEMCVTAYGIWAIADCLREITCDLYSEEEEQQRYRERRRP